MQRPQENRTHRNALWAVAILFAFSSLGCGKKARPTAESVAAGSAHASSKKTKRDGKVAGSWRWSHLSDKTGVRRVELEHWVLTHSGNDQVRGHYERLVTFMSLDGVPFRCSQSLRYQLSSRYTLRGSFNDGKLSLNEVKYRSSDSPCDTGHRQLSSYKGNVTDDALVLMWQGGSQTLSRSSTNAPIAPNAPIASAHAATSITTGTWRWQNRRQVGDEVRVESEQWTLTEDKAKVITGTYQRVVTVFTQNGKTYQCNGNTSYAYTDTYTVRGSRTGDRIILSEIAAQPSDSSCISYKQRHLDAATGTLKGNFLILEWRGRHSQILHR